MFSRIGDRNPNRTVPRLQELTRHLWQGERQHSGHHHYDGKIPIIATGLRNLREHGPTGPVFLRFGRDHPRSPVETIGSPRRDAADVRAQEEAWVRQREYKAQLRRAAEQKAAEREGPPARLRRLRGRSSPTNGGKQPGRRTGAPRWTATRSSATTASARP
ncbi:hypothetical protein ACIBBB_35775 [Streptomyces sp. NPDC051217]|uniref:hypothetical protein n=1 Tax=Streptomyces sp. NPDC051217 TaxID=3365644 RepID=UPI0037ADC28E